MAPGFDFVVVGAGSAGAVIAARLSEDPTCRVALIEAGERPPPEELMPLACATLQLNPATDWMYTADAGNAGLGLAAGRMMVPRGKMLGGSSGMNYLAYVRGHPGDFDSWAANGAEGWSYAELLNFFTKSEAILDSDDLILDNEAHGRNGPLDVAVRFPVLSGSREFVAAAKAAGIPEGDYNGRDRGGPSGVASLFQTTLRDGKRASTYHAFLEGAAEQRPNLEVISGAHVTRIVLQSGPEGLVATGVEYQGPDGSVRVASARKEVVLSAGAVGSPQLLLLSGIGPKAELDAVGIACLSDSPEVGKHLKDHLQVFLVYPAAGSGVSLTEIGISMGPDALRTPGGPLPADPAEDAELPDELLALKQEAERRLLEWESTGRGLASSSLYDAAAWFSTGLGDAHTHDAQIGFFACGDAAESWRSYGRIDPDVYFDDPAVRLGDDAESIILLANPVQPHSEGEVVLRSADPFEHPEIRMNYFTDPHDLPVMIAVIRRALDLAAKWPAPSRPGPLLVPPHLADKHAHTVDAEPSDALLADLARHYANSVYHLTSTCRIGSVVDSRLRLNGVANLRIADASVMPNITSGNTNAVAIMIGEKAADMLATDHKVQLATRLTPADARDR
jgi:choline dehydrogenase